MCVRALRRCAISGFHYMSRRDMIVFQCEVGYSYEKAGTIYFMFPISILQCLIVR